MLRKILAILVIAIGIFVMVASRQPSEFRVYRTAVMDAPPAAIFPLVNNLHQWEGWSPWAKLDPNAKMGYEGPAAGVGSAMFWDGNMKVGAGRTTITESIPNERVAYRLDFTKPFKATSMAEFVLAPDRKGKQTTVTWSMSGHNNFVAKVMSLFMDCDKMIGAEFEKGLAAIGAAVATPAKK